MTDTRMRGIDASVILLFPRHRSPTVHTCRSNPSKIPRSRRRYQGAEVRPTQRANADHAQQAQQSENASPPSCVCPARVGHDVRAYGGVEGRLRCVLSRSLISDAVVAEPSVSRVAKGARSPACFSCIRCFCLAPHLLSYPTRSVPTSEPLTQLANVGTSEIPIYCQ